MNFYKIFSEAEAFTQAQTFYESIGSDFPRNAEAQKLVAEVEVNTFRPALELQVAGLALLAGKKLQNEIDLPVSFALYVVDHLAMGWFDLLFSHYRVAYSLCRGAVEASIFEVASSVALAKFPKLWSTPTGTGGSVLNQIKHLIPKEEFARFQIAWNLTKALGHASFTPVVAPRQIHSGPGGQAIGVMTLGGPHLPPNKEVLEDLSLMYGLGAIVGLTTMKMALVPHFGATEMWVDRYEKLMQAGKIVAEGAIKKLGPTGYAGT